MNFSLKSLFLSPAFKFSTPFCRNLAAVLLVLSTACTGNNGTPALFEPGNEEIRHARGFDFEQTGDFTLLSVYNPWQGAGNLAFRYLLAGPGADPENEIPPEYSTIPVIRTPVTSVICLSTTHIAMLDFIDETKSIVAVSGGELIFHKGIRERLERGELPDIGYDLSLDYERILDINPDVVLAYGVDSEATAWLDRMRSLGINVVMIGEYLENSPLAQAEWARFVALLFDKQELASEKFCEIEKEYQVLAGMAASVKEKPVVMSGVPWRNSWFVSGGNSHFARLVADAGGKYLWDDNRNRENFPVDMETVLEKASDAAYWINPGSALSLSEIEGIDNRLTTLRPYRINNVYNNNARLNRSGGNDYWESGIVRPHVILRDLIHILHPGILPGHEPFYYRQL